MQCFSCCNAVLAAMQFFSAMQRRSGADTAAEEAAAAAFQWRRRRRRRRQWTGTAFSSFQIPRVDSVSTKSRQRTGTAFSCFQTLRVDSVSTKSRILSNGGGGQNSSHTRRHAADHITFDRPAAASGRQHRQAQPAILGVHLASPSCSGSRSQSISQDTVHVFDAFFSTASGAAPSSCLSCHTALCQQQQRGSDCRKTHHRSRAHGSVALCFETAMITCWRSGPAIRSLAFSTSR